MTQTSQLITIHIPLYLIMKVLLCSLDQAETNGSWLGSEHHNKMERTTRWNGVSQGEITQYT